MPTRLTRYVLAEIIKIFVVSLVVLTIIVLLIVVGRELHRKGMSPGAVLQVLPFMAPLALQFAMPATVLFSVCCVFGRMAADGELATVKSSGISPLRILKPAFIFAVLLSPVSVILSDLTQSWGEPGFSRVVMMSIEDIAYRQLGSLHAYSNDGFSIHVREVIGRRLIRPTLTFRHPGQKEQTKITASEGKLTLDPNGMVFTIELTDALFDQTDDDGSGKYYIEAPGFYSYDFPIPGASGSLDPRHAKPSDLPLLAIGREQVRQNNKNHAIVGKQAAQTAFSILSSRPEQIAGPTGQKIENELNSGKRRLVRLHTEPWRRWAQGFTCFFFVLVGAPLAMIAKSSDYWSTFGMCFLPTQLIYWPLFILGLEQAKDGVVPPYGVWIGNLAMLLVGVVLLTKVRRH